MNPRLHALFDRLGATGALLCAIHCALLPLLIALLPSLGLSAALAPTFEVGFVLFATLFGLAVLVWSYRRHRAMRALWLLIRGWRCSGSGSCTRRCTIRWCRMRWR
jgi:hypothetical protein